MGKRLQTVEDHVTDITISTATVDIQVMRIGAKQMTLAVFRQLPYLDIFDNSGNLLAPPWGWVNYDRNGSYAQPFVFSHKGILYRCKVDIDFSSQLRVWRELKQQYIAAHADGGHWIGEKTVQTPTGKFIVSKRQTSWPEDELVYEVFATESEADAYLKNRMEGIATLEAAPQLFIGV